MQVYFLSRDDSILVSLDPQHLKDLCYFLFLSRLYDTVCFRIRQMNLASLFRHFHQFFTLELILLFYYCFMILVKMIPDFGLTRHISWGTPCLRTEQWLTSLWVNILQVITEPGSAAEQLRYSLLLFLYLNYSQLSESVKDHH